MNESLHLVAATDQQLTFLRKSRSIWTTYYAIGVIIGTAFLAWVPALFDNLYLLVVPAIFLLLMLSKTVMIWVNHTKDINAKKVHEVNGAIQDKRVEGLRVPSYFLKINQTEVPLGRSGRAIFDSAHKGDIVKVVVGPHSQLLIEFEK